MRVSRDIVVDFHDEEHNEVWVTSPVPVRRDEVLTLDLLEPGRTLAVRVVESSPVLADGLVQHRLRLAILR